MNATAQARATPANHYARDFAKLCRLLMLAKGNARTAAQLDPDGQSSLLHNTLTKADPGAIGGSSPTSWAGQIADYKVLSSAFLATLRSVGIFDRMLPDMLRVPFRTHIAVSTFAVTGSDVGEADTKPVSDLQFGADVLDFRKAAALCVISDELARLVSAEGLIEAELRNGVVAAVDRDFLAKLIAAGGAAVPSSGDVMEDLANLFASVEGGSASAWYFVVPVAVAAQLATTPSAVGGAAHPAMTPKGGVIAGIPVLVSGELDDEAVLVDASQVAVAAEGLSVEVATHAALAVESPAGPLVSLWQKNLRGIRAERWWDATVLRSSAVASLSGVGYSGGSPA